MKRFLTAILSLLLIVSLTCVAFAASTDQSGDRVYVVDQADLLSESEEAELERMAEEISQKQKCDVVILTVPSTGLKSLRDFADDYYDQHGYGYGKDQSGILFLLSMEKRDWYMSACGEGSKIFTDSKIDEIFDECATDISNGNYARGFRTFLEKSEAVIKFYRRWIVRNTLLSLIIGFLLAFIFSGNLRSQLKSVRMKYNASNYRRPDSMHLETNRDVYLFTNTTSRVIETQQRSGGGGSSSHTSSSGVTHTGHGGKF